MISKGIQREKERNRERERERERERRKIVEFVLMLFSLLFLLSLSKIYGTVDLMQRSWHWGLASGGVCLSTETGSSMGRGVSVPSILSAP